MIDHCKDMPATDATASAKVVRLLLQACLAVIEPDASEPEPRRESDANRAPRA